MDRCCSECTGKSVVEGQTFSICGFPETATDSTRVSIEKVRRRKERFGHGLEGRTTVVDVGVYMQRNERPVSVGVAFNEHNNDSRDSS